MKKVNITISEEVYETADYLALALDVSRGELLRFCLEGLTNPQASRSAGGRSFVPKGLTNPTRCTS